MKSRAIVICACVILWGAVNAFSQSKPNTLNVSIALDKNRFLPHERIKVRVTVENRMGKDIKTDSIAVSFHLSKYGKDLEKCRFPDCFIAFTYWAKKFKNGQRSDLEVDLTDLSWKELISSQDDPRRPKNLYEKVSSGEYSLFMDFHFPVESVTSNAILVNIDSNRARKISHKSATH